MRTLYVHRKKCIYGWAVRYFIYLVDEKNGDSTKNGMPCRLVGTVRNGKTCEIEIPEEGCMVYIAASRVITSEGCKSVHFPKGSEPEHVYFKPSMGFLTSVPIISRNEDMSNAF